MSFTNNATHFTLLNIHFIREFFSNTRLETKSDHIFSYLIAMYSTLNTS